MYLLRIIGTIFLSLIVLSTSAQDREVLERRKKFPLAASNAKIFQRNGKKYLYGGENSNQHFDISNCSLNENQFHFGIGREEFPALLKPEFMSVQEANREYDDDARFLLLSMDGVTKAYSVEDLKRHEVVNDEINGRPIMAAFCVLADLGAIYERRLGNRTFTFALSGYTYYDDQVWDGMDGFVMWDRETESLWWPLIGKSVSGPLKGTRMKVLDEGNWAQTTWREIRNNHPDALVMQSGLDFERPFEWQTFSNARPIRVSGKSIAPRWGENPQVREQH